MGANTTVVFADLTGSTGVFEALGNAKATQAITRLTQWISQVCEAHEGRVVKTLGDGVLAVFPAASDAADAVIELQRSHHKRILSWPEKLRMRLQIGVAYGEVVEVDGDCYGDAVNVASRLSDLSGPEQIWATDSVIQQLPKGRGIRFRSLGPINIRGKSEARVVYRIDWQEEVQSDFLTVPASLSMLRGRPEAEAGGIELSWLDMREGFKSTDMPIHLGRVSEAEFVVNDQRVSRLHAKIEWRGGTFVLSDLSSYGTWVRFSGSETELALRRGECVLHGSGEVALGAPFSDFTVPTVSFILTGASGQSAVRGGDMMR
ncbi:MAG: adenylate/guanylate cyclase domain-containing protein [Burkholderiaceae bacterium]|nr:adenylate/guanylate cyclase domain-containing protein [Burkholderiaceae bacterium]